MDNKDKDEQMSQSQAAQPSIELLTRYGTFQCENSFREYVAEAIDGPYVKLHEVKRLLSSQPLQLQDIEQYRQQMAGISCASFGHWKEGDSIYPGYDTVTLRDVAKLYAKYAVLAGQSQATRAVPGYENTPIAYAENGVLHWMTGRKFDNCELYARPTAQEVTQQAAKAETAEQAEGEQANVLPPTRGADSQQDASGEVLTNAEIVELANEHDDPEFGLQAFPFARAVEAEVVRRCRAQRTNNNDNGSVIAPTTSTVSAPEDLVEKAAKLCDSAGHHWSGAPALAMFELADAIRALRTTSGKGEAA